MFVLLKRKTYNDLKDAVTCLEVVYSGAKADRERLQDENTCLIAENKDLREQIKVMRLALRSTAGTDTGD